MRLQKMQKMQKRGIHLQHPPVVLSSCRPDWSSHPGPGNANAGHLKPSCLLIHLARFRPFGHLSAGRA